MTRLREAPTAEALIAMEALQQRRRSFEVLDRRLYALEQDFAELARAVKACRRAINQLPEGPDRDELRARADALAA